METNIVKIPFICTNLPIHSFSLNYDETDFETKTISDLIKDIKTYQNESELSMSSISTFYSESLDSLSSDEPLSYFSLLFPFYFNLDYCLTLNGFRTSKRIILPSLNISVKNFKIKNLNFPEAKLIFNNEVLDNNKNLSDYNLKSNDLIEMLTLT